MKAGIVIETRSADETQALGYFVGKVAAQGTVFCLEGELGAGKTVFVRGLARGRLGNGQLLVTSPTYVLQHIYRGGSGTVYHLDLYRLTGGPADFEGAGLGECLEDSGALICIEWPERVLDILPEDRVEVEIDHEGPAGRRVHLHATGPLCGRMIDDVARSVGSRERLRAFIETGLQMPDVHAS
jgi:tRNA threonylcarbamoyladenosine biosynthesis protein TsaE